MKILVMGGSGLLGSALVKSFASSGKHDVHFTYRTSHPLEAVAATAHRVPSIDEPELSAVVSAVGPKVVVNCIGHIKQKDGADDVLAVVPINTMLPHVLARICGQQGSRLIHFSTDCVFSGRDGNYADDALSDVNDLYGLSKFLGEVKDKDHVLTLRTSIIGQLKGGTASLVDWFLAQSGNVKGFTKAIFSGLTTDEVARVLDTFVFGRPELKGLYNLAVDPIAKYDLLRLVADVYGMDITIESSDALRIDRSLNADRFKAATGYVPPSWPELIRAMHTFHHG
jgi:dTDP-4-dehydrorhamnose reductase